jgi:UDP-2,3-diacylglucosamine hydrolase
MPGKIYFASDFHLGIDADLTSSEREKKIVRWLQMVSEDAEAVYLVGDVFDYWFEYRHAIPKGYSRLLGQLASMRDKGISLYFFTGNHDMWMFRYFEEELDIPIYRHPIRINLKGKKFQIGHGDGLGPGDKGYKMIKRIFSYKWAQKAFSWVHPDWGLPLMKFFSAKSRAYTGDESAFNPEKEWLVRYCEQDVISHTTDYYIFGHRHLTIDYTIPGTKTRYINLGEWLFACSYAVWDGNELTIQFFESEHTHIFGMNTASK